MGKIRNFKEGRFITLEGGEGVGKSTQIKLLARSLENVGIKTVLTREPGGSPGAEQIRELLVSGDPERWDGTSETLLHFAARRDHLTKIILPALKKGHWVISDRFVDSTMAYQSYGLGINKADIKYLYKFVAGDKQPDLTIVLDLSPIIGIKRSKLRLKDGKDQYLNKQDRYENMVMEFHERLREGFLKIAKINQKRCAVIDASQDINKINQEIERIVFSKFGIENCD